MKRVHIVIIQDSELIAWIDGQITCCLDQDGIEIQAPSTSRDGSNSWFFHIQRPKPSGGGIVS